MKKGVYLEDIELEAVLLTTLANILDNKEHEIVEKIGMDNILKFIEKVSSRDYSEISVEEQQKIVANVVKKMLDAYGIDDFTEGYTKVLH